jgi:hypothetical protein
MSVHLKKSHTTPKRRVSDRAMIVGLAALASLGVMTLPLRADAAGGHPGPTGRDPAEWNAISASAHTQRSAASRGVEKDENTPTCHPIPTASAAATDAPQINILAPTLGTPLVSPLDIEVQFVPATSDAAVQADTFRVCLVGFFTVDITKRITDRVTVSPNGVHVSGAQLPHGHHHLVMLISDQDGRIGRRDATFDIQ